MGQPHYFSAEPGSLGPVSELTVTLAGLEASVVTAPGVFSARRLDPGTAVLLRTAARLPGGRCGLPQAGVFVDLGSGWGALALAMAARAPAAEVWAIDVNPRALELTELNARRAGLSNIRAAGPEALEALRGRIDALWSNPPIRIGRPALRALLADWLGALASDAEATLVIQRHLGADSLARWLASQGFDIGRRGSAKGYRVLSASRPPTPPAPGAP